MRFSGKGRDYCIDDETVGSVADNWADWDEDNYGYYKYDEDDTNWQDYEFDYDAVIMILYWIMSSTSPSANPVIPYILMSGRDLMACEWSADRLGPYNLFFEYVTNSDTVVI